MDAPLVLYLDGEPCLEAGRGGVPGQLRGLFARLDADMDQGIEIDGVRVPTPDGIQRGRYVLGRLLAALAGGEREFAHTLLIYIALNWPDLRAVRVDSGAEDWAVELEFR
ncbi:MAG: hypothetical protein ACLGH6_01730 [Gammaproteobacteria bacterium]